MRIINRSIGFHACLTEATTWWNELVMEEVGCTALEVPELETPGGQVCVAGRCQHSPAHSQSSAPETGSH